ncbi:type VI immunity family protein [Achromobacter sp. UBA2119]|uniref:type VI immunity family protein n=1 Tax=Achromobacter sp. UBA2119 TaxID=1945911 RepID=UPI00257A8A54|nr:type VI immunity family protein [Achromobacter sp. UBA2119]
MTDFFNEFDAERWYFTFADEDDNTLIVQQVGIVAVFHLVDAYLPVRRKGIAEALSLYHELYGDKLKGGYRADKRMIVRPFSKMGFESYRDYVLATSPMDVIEFDCMSTLSLGHASDYMFGVFSPAGWYEQVHKRLTTVRIYLPVEELVGEGRARFESFLLKCCALLRPLHGAAGLGIQECHDWEDYQTLEHETAWAYRGVDLCGPSEKKNLREGYKNLNWYTFLAHHWIATLGTPEELKSKLNDDRIELLPYEWGTAIRAGDWPALGKAETDPTPELYVKVNNAIRSLRVQDIGSLHYGSIAGEVRFNPLTSNLWLRRFDTPQEIKAVIDEAGNVKADERHFLRMPSGTPCPWPGIWICEEDPSQGRKTFMHNDLLPEVNGQVVTWRLIKAL